MTDAQLDEYVRAIFDAADEAASAHDEAAKDQARQRLHALMVVERADR